MKANVIFLGQRSVTIELDNKLPYYSDEMYDVYVNGVKYEEKVQLNVYSIYNLEPSTNYSVEYCFKNEKIIIEFETKPEFVTRFIRLLLASVT